MVNSATKRARTGVAPMRKEAGDDFVFPFDLSTYRKVLINPFTDKTLSVQQKEDLAFNINLCRDAIVFFTACGAASGYSGHTGGAFDIVPETLIMDAFFRTCPDRFVPVFFDEAGHRVAIQYLMSALHGHIDPELLRFYRKGHSCLPGHPELGCTPGIKFSSGRLGHMWAHVNGVAMANPGKQVFCLGSDGSQMEGNDAEAARLAVAQDLNVNLILDDNDVTITGHPSQYFKGCVLEKTLTGHGLECRVADGENLEELYNAVRAMVVHSGPTAVIARRKMCPGIKGAEGSSHGHDVLAVPKAIEYFTSRGLVKAVEYLEVNMKTKDPHNEYLSCGPKDAMRSQVGKTVVQVLSKMTAKERKEKVMVIDSDLGGSTSFNEIQTAYPEIYVQSGIMERGNFSAAAGFGMEEGKQGVFSTFAAFLEMCCSEITMARLNKCNVFSHFSHSGVDDMADNTCHFGINNMFADNGLEDDSGHQTRLYFPADVLQAEKVVQTVFFQPGLRFVFTTRSKTPQLLKPDGSAHYGEGYTFEPGKDEFLRHGTAGYVLSFGDALYRCMDAVERLRAEGIDIGLVNKPTLNVVDEDAIQIYGSSPLLLVVEPLGKKTGLGSKFGTYLLERGLSPKFATIATHQEGCGGLWEQAYHQGYDSKSVQAKVKSMLSKKISFMYEGLEMS